jgi:hypothetical protein
VSDSGERKRELCWPGEPIQALLGRNQIYIPILDEEENTMRDWRNLKYHLEENVEA